ncbi:MAG TPA: T9SS type A sorting domain-containing protein, partial [Chitinophagaceae bacterium]|nr:T9SS type A sorting domain-containing protein [Chitinophagaceae bacterium]
ANNVNSGVERSWFRETGLAKKISDHNPSVLANAVTELSSYNYTDAGDNWTGFAGTVYERGGVSRCAQVASSFSYANSQPGITVRMGYDYNPGSNGGRPVRQYGSRLGCFNFPSLSTLPVDLLSFSASYNNDMANLKWSSDREMNFEKYIIERSFPGADFTAVGEKRASGNNGKTLYDWAEDLSNVNGSTFYYRLKMVDIDGKFSYSPVVMVKKDAKAINGITISPNPVANSATTVRFTATNSSSIELRVVDISGKLLLQQKNNVAEGTNSISINNLDRLQPGTYLLQVLNEGESTVTKFSVVR